MPSSTSPGGTPPRFRTPSICFSAVWGLGWPRRSRPAGPRAPWGVRPGPSRTSSGRLRPRRTRSVSCWGGIPARSRGAHPCSRSRWCLRSRRGCRPPSSSGAPTCGSRGRTSRRPDLRQAEQQLVQANAQVGVAVANFFPQIILSGFGGGVSPQLSGMSSVWSLTAGLTGPIFQGGQIRANYQASVAAWEQAKLQYEQAVITAFKEVASALTALEKLAQVEAEQARAVRAYADAVQIAIR